MTNPIKKNYKKISRVFQKIKKRHYANDRNENMSDENRRRKKSIYKKLLLQKKTFVDLLINHVEQLKNVSLSPKQVGGSMRPAPSGFSKNVFYRGMMRG